MRRIAATSVSFLLIGLLIALALAWACALWSPVDDVNAWLVDGRPSKRQLEADRKAIERVLAGDESLLDDARTHRRHELGFGCDVTWYRHFSENSLFMPSGASVRIRAGWPWRCVRLDGALEPGSGRTFLLGTTHWREAGWNAGVDAPAFLDARPISDGLPARFPLVPTPGLLANTAFWAVITWNLWFLIISARAGLRRRRGLCAGCGYLLGPPVTCPECGCSSHEAST